MDVDVDVDIGNPVANVDIGNLVANIDVDVDVKDAKYAQGNDKPHWNSNGSDSGHSGGGSGRISGRSGWRQPPQLVDIEPYLHDVVVSRLWKRLQEVRKLESMALNSSTRVL